MLVVFPLPSTNPIFCQLELNSLSTSKPLLFVSVAVCQFKVTLLLNDSALKDVNSTGTISRE